MVRRTSVSSLLLIRHGQASFGAADYDVLSPLGEAQASRLGDYLATRATGIDALYTGPRKRQRDTAALMRQAAVAGGLSVPEPVLIEEFDEFPAFELFKRFLPVVQNGELEGAIESGDRRRVEAAYFAVTGAWCRGELDCGGLETYEQFMNRVSRGVEKVIAAHGRGVRVAVVTSAGPVAITLRLTMGLPAESLNMAWVVKNASYSEFRYRSQNDIGLFGFNHSPHLDDTEVTFR